MKVLLPRVEVEPDQPEVGETRPGGLDQDGPGEFNQRGEVVVKLSGAKSGHGNFMPLLAGFRVAKIFPNIIFKKILNMHESFYFYGFNIKKDYIN